eukprot:1451241-Rhodomonas_salina.1
MPARSAAPCMPARSRLGDCPRRRAPRSSWATRAGTTLRLASALATSPPASPTCPLAQLSSEAAGCRLLSAVPHG